jgi:hypothetical protein
MTDTGRAGIIVAGTMRASTSARVRTTRRRSAAHWRITAK